MMGSIVAPPGDTNFNIRYRVCNILMLEGAGLTCGAGCDEGVYGSPLGIIIGHVLASIRVASLA